LTIKTTFIRIHRAFHILALLSLVATAIALTGVTLAAAFGVLPWLNFTLSFGEISYVMAGQITQIAITVLMVALAAFLPANSRILMLERSHRDFNLSMEDVARAYHLCHTADRSGVFSLSAEFDAVRERLVHLRDHPDLGALEPDVLEVAAQMSHTARHLADVYSDEKVSRAKTFLQQRQEETELQQERIVEALHACRDIRKWSQQVELEESVVASQLAVLEEQLEATLPALGYSLGKDSANVVPLEQKPAAE